MPSIRVTNIALVVAIATFSAGAALAQTPPADRSAELTRQIQALTERVKTLESAFGQGPGGRFLALSNDQSKPTVVSGADAEGHGRLRINDTAGRTAVVATADKDGGQLWLNSTGGKHVLDLSATDSGGAVLLSNEKGETRLFTGIVDEGGVYNAYHSNGEVVAVLRSLGKGGFLRLNDTAGKSAVEMGVDDESGRPYGNIGNVRLVNDADGGLILINDAAGKRVIELGVTDSGAAHFTLNGRQMRDYAEVFDLKTRDGVGPGTVMAAADDGSGAIEPSSGANDPRVVGVVGGAGGLRHAMLVGTREDGSRDHAIALAGQVYVRVTVENGPIEPGNLLVGGTTRGTAMRAKEGVDTAGRVLGKALGRFDGTGEGLVLMLVMPR